MKPLLFQSLGLLKEIRILRVEFLTQTVLIDSERLYGPASAWSVGLGEEHGGACVSDLS